MIHRTDGIFWRHYRALSADSQPQADKQLDLLKFNPCHPSLHFKKLDERCGQEIWSARVTLNYRALAVKFPDALVWYWIGEHGVYNLLIQ